MTTCFLASTAFAAHGHVLRRVLEAVEAFVQLAVRVDVWFDRLGTIIILQLLSSLACDKVCVPVVMASLVAEATEQWRNLHVGMEPCALGLDSETPMHATNMPRTMGKLLHNIVGTRTTNADGNLVKQTQRAMHGNDHEQLEMFHCLETTKTNFDCNIGDEEMHARRNTIQQRRNTKFTQQHKHAACDVRTTCANCNNGTSH